MLIVKVVKEELFYLQDEDIEQIADHEGVSVEDCIDMIDKGEVDLDNIEHYSSFDSYTLIDYKVEEG